MDALDRIVPPVRVDDRLVVRYRMADDSATDVIGWLQAVDSYRLSICDHAGRTVVVDRRRLVAARRAPAARGGPGPTRTSPEELERLALPGWLADHEPLGEWTLRAADGFTGRGNSCLAVGDPGLPVAEAAARIVTFAAWHRLEPRAQVIAGSRPDRDLRVLGWTPTYATVDVLAVRLNDLLGETPRSPLTQTGEVLTPDWEHAYHRSRPNTADPAVVHALLDGGRPRAFAALTTDSEIAAIGRGHVSSEWLGLTSVWTAPDHRGQGYTGQIVRALGHWAARLNARYVYLQVDQSNTAAQLAYRRLGFSLHHSYLYLTPASAAST